MKRNFPAKILRRAPWKRERAQEKERKRESARERQEEEREKKKKRRAMSELAEAYASTRQGYKYLPLVEAGNRVQTYANIYAVVLECSPPRETKGSDSVVNLKLVDGSFRDGLELICFAPEANDLPQVASQGDIIRLHRVKVGEWSGRPQLVGKVGSAFSFLLFRGDGGEKPYMSSSKSHTFTDEDRKQLKLLREDVNVMSTAPSAPPANGNNNASASAPASAAPASDECGDSEFPTKISDLGAKSSSLRSSSLPCEILCMIVYTDATEDVYYVWDGTDVQPKLSTEDNTAHMMDLYPECDFLSSDFLRTEMPLDMLKFMADARNAVKDKMLVQAGYGTLLPLRATPAMANTLRKIVGFKWLVLTGLQTIIVQGQVQALFTEKSKCSYFKPKEGSSVASNPRLKSVEQKIKENRVSSWAPSTPEEIRRLLTRTLHPSKPFTTLREIRLAAGTNAPNKYRTLARVVGFLPEDLTECCKEGKNKDGTKTYTFNLTLRLEDSTGDLDVAMWGKHAEDFLGLKACDMRVDTDQHHEVQQRISHMMGYLPPGGEKEQQEGKSNGSKDNIFWLDICLFSYHTQLDSQDALWDSCKYGIFDTNWRDR